MAQLSQVIAQSPEKNNVRVGVVTQTSPLMVSLSGGTISQAGRLSSYTPVVGHIVAMIRQDSTWLVLGRVVT